MEVNYFFLTQNSAKKAHNGKSKINSKIDTISKNLFFSIFDVKSLQVTFYVSRVFVFTQTSVWPSAKLFLSNHDQNIGK